MIKQKLGFRIHYTPTNRGYPKLYFAPVRLYRASVFTERKIRMLSRTPITNINNLYLPYNSVIWVKTNNAITRSLRRKM